MIFGHRTSLRLQNTTGVLTWAIYEPDFYFLIFSNTNIIDRKIYKITLNDTRIEEHINFLYKIKKIKADAEQNGWKAYPDPKNCSNCPVSKDCLHFTNIPQIKEIYY